MICRTNDFHFAVNRWWQNLTRIMQLTLDYSRGENRGLPQPGCMDKNNQQWCDHDVIVLEVVEVLKC